MSSSASPAEPHEIAGVVPLVTTWRLDRALDYSFDGMDLKPGMVVQVPLAGRSVRGIVTSTRVGVPERDLHPIKKIVVDAAVVPPGLTGFFDWLADRYVVPRAQIYGRAVPQRVKARPREDPTRPERSSGSGALSALVGGDDLISAIRARSAGLWCVRPPWRADRSALIADLVTASPATVLVTVPEVAYGSEVANALRERFPDVVRIDSAQEPRERAASLMALAHGARLSVGGRASVFAPSNDVSLIVVDEEHDRSYKEDRTPRVDARVALAERARRQGAICVFVSAHPRVETAYAALTGAIRQVNAERPAERAARPHVEFVDKDQDSPISRTLHKRIKETVERGARVGLLAPARGYARALWCSSCRRSVKCRRCESGVRFDRARGLIECPSCGFTEPPPQECPSCGSIELRYLGAGIERLEEQLSKAFPRARVVRVDADTVRAESSMEDADIYVTTWIGTKPVLRPDVGMVGLLDADALLRRPDFRAAEHAYQAISEMAEWAGPAAAGGRLLVQTDDSGHPVMQAIARADYSFFLRHELTAREELAYPPFSELVTVRGQSIDSPALVRAAQICKTTGARVLGPAPNREAGPTLVAKCPSAQQTAIALRDLASSPEGRTISIDVDPR